MVCRHYQELDALVQEAKKRTEEGKVADYIPALAESEQDSLSVTIYHAENTCLTAGDADRTFTLQSISKVLSSGARTDGLRKGKGVQLRGSGADRRPV